MNTKETAQHYGAKIFDSPEAARAAGFVLRERLAPRNVWNKASAAQSLLLKLLEEKRNGAIEEVGIVIEPMSVTACYKPSGQQKTA